MSDSVFVVVAIALIVDIFALAYFSAIKPKISVNRFLYLIFGILLIPIGIYIGDEADLEFIQEIWFYIFAATGIIAFIGLSIKYHKIKGTKKEAQFNAEFGKNAVKHGVRTLPKNLR